MSFLTLNFRVEHPMTEKVKESRPTILLALIPIIDIVF